MSNESQQDMFGDAGFDQLLEHMPAINLTDEQQAIAAFKEHLWALVLIVENRLDKHFVDAKTRQISAEIIAEIAHYQGGRCRYLPSGEKLKQELRDIHIFDLWRNKNWTPKQIQRDFCPSLTDITIYDIIKRKRKEYVSTIQPSLFGKTKD
jgi:Mor family transcriptional regulator